MKTLSIIFMIIGLLFGGLAAAQQGGWAFFGVILSLISVYWFGEQYDKLYSKQEDKNDIEVLFPGWYAAAFYIAWAAMANQQLWCLCG